MCENGHTVSQKYVYIWWETPAASLCEETFDLVTDFWFDSRIPWKFFKKHAAFLDFVLSCIYCTRMVQVHGQKIREIFSEVSFIIFVYSDGKNLKRNIHENAAYFFENFHGIQEPNQKSVTKSTGILTSGFFTRSGRRRFPSSNVDWISC